MQDEQNRYDRRQNRSFNAADADDLDLDRRGEQRRRNHRLPLRLWTEGRSDGRLDFHNCSNLSEEGMYIETSDPYPLGALVDIEFNLPGVHAPIHTRGRVVSALDDMNAGANIMGNGFLFEEISEDDQVLIRTYVKASQLIVS